MITEIGNVGKTIAELIINELIKCGVKYFFVSPGSRSTLLTTAACEAERNGSANVDICIDERSAAFKCLGFSKAGKSPGAVICTSGSAAANYFPAIVEAAESSVPMIVLTADRPDELHDCGSNQTINQNKIFGNYAKYFTDIDCSSQSTNIANILSSIDYAAFAIQNYNPGAAHFNCKFREPFFNNNSQLQLQKFVSNRTASDKQFTIYINDVESRKNKISERYQSPLFVFGENGNHYFECGKFAGLMNIPAVFDIMSGMRGMKFSNELKYFDEMIKEGKLQNSPDAIFYFGGKIISKQLMKFINNAVENEGADLLIFNNSRRRFDPAANSNFRITVEPKQAADFVKEIINCRSENKQFTNIEGKVSPESIIIEKISGLISSETNIFIGNSMTIRNFNRSFYNFDGSKIHLFYNRGASGIDGNIAATTGIAAASGRFTLGIIGDLTAFHDLNSLIHLRNSSVPVCLIIFNNNGGKIFRALPVKDSEFFEKAFLTPLNISFEHAAEMFSLQYFTVKNIEEFTTAFINAQNLKKSSVIEISTVNE